MTPPVASPTARSAAPPLRRPIAPRRVSGPARRATRVRPVEPAPLLLRLVDHPLLDRLIRGRMWIGLIAFALLSIVAMQVTLLKLNRGIGTQIQRAQSLTRENGLLAAQVSTLEASERIQGLAAQRGMVPAPAGEVRYLGVGSGDALRAASSITAPRLSAAVSSAGLSTSSGSTSSGSGSTSAGSSASAADSSAAPSPVSATAGPSGDTTTTAATPNAAADTGATSTSAASAGAQAGSVSTTPSANAAAAQGSTSNQGGPARRP